ncbi:Ribonuclease 3 [Chlamydiales bacterium SCGC AG-110-P3]|nr:Ribonuclease 3 [Chlamydiales bacterium SCGC AG-110-P3]
MNPIEQLLTNASRIEAKLGYQFRDRELLALSFVHRSFVNENRQVTNSHNERLEFLGDSVLGLIISEYLYRYLPSKPEGELSYLRSRLVEASSCCLYIQHLDVEQYLLLGRGEGRNAGRGRDSILADLFEAVIGAIYLDGGLAATKRFLFKTFSEHFQNILRTPERNWKALLQDYAQKNYQQTPIYEVVSEKGPDHNKVFQISVTVDNQSVGEGEGPSKKEAQQIAAQAAVKHYGLDIKTDTSATDELNN